MRAFINAILAFIQSTSLTDDEFATITISVEAYTAPLYIEILSVLNSRSLVGDGQSRLLNYFLARGVAVVTPSSAISNIFVGDAL